MSRGERFEFEGLEMTVSEIAAVIPALRAEAIRWHLRNGRNTRAAMLCYYRKKSKPKRASQLRIGRKIPHAFGGPKPSQPKPIK